MHIPQYGKSKSDKVRSFKCEETSEKISLECKE